MNGKVCQSCGMPMTAKEHFGNNQDGSINSDYCAYCFKDGNFTSASTMDEMIAENVASSDSFALKDEKGNLVTKEEAISKMKTYFPTLKRWKN